MEKRKGSEKERKARGDQDKKSLKQRRVLRKEGRKKLGKNIGYKERNKKRKNIIEKKKRNQ